MDQLTSYLEYKIIIFLILLPGILIGLTFHEWSHGRVAYSLGDPTPSEQGRLTLNPLPHIDWLGFLMIALFHFGWAKPVQVNPYRFKKANVKQGMMLVSLAGPGMNFLIAVVGAIFYHLFSKSFYSSEWISWLLVILACLVYINLILGVFNLIPVPPLDGSKILAGLLPDSGAKFIYSLEPYGMAILLLIIFTNIADLILFPMVGFFMNNLQVPIPF